MVSVDSVVASVGRKVVASVGQNDRSCGFKVCHIDYGTQMGLAMSLVEKPI